ncbi:hypothetical protein SKAU_G00365060 [Synaphobranchus kaupii]|uniref:Uncharacterized protein n=1 Tax=Synaphobranchus kaupii TaxID=118154 RepID=A0A9Q1EEX3_SYNKA|nr:hypothetical protein SKAU_G00365060 [Synaphobranchus kaupii]
MSVQRPLLPLPTTPCSGTWPPSTGCAVSTRSEKKIDTPAGERIPPVGDITSQNTSARSTLASWIPAVCERGESGVKRPSTAGFIEPPSPERKRACVRGGGVRLPLASAWGPRRSARSAHPSHELVDVPHTGSHIRAPPLFAERIPALVPDRPDEKPPRAGPLKRQPRGLLLLCVDLVTAARRPLSDGKDLLPPSVRQVASLRAAVTRNNSDRVKAVQRHAATATTESLLSPRRRTGHLTCVTYVLIYTRH